MHCGHNIATGTIDAMTGGLRARECPLNLVSVLVSQYEPELFPGLIYRMKVPKVVLLIFVSGKVVLTGTAIPPSPLVLACAVHIALRVQGPWSLGDLGEAAGAAGDTGVCGGDVQAPRRRKRFTRRLRTSIRCWGSSARATRQRRPRSRQPCRCSRPLPTRAAGRDSGVCLSRSSSDICLDKTGSYGTPSQQSEAKTTTSFLMGRRRDQRLQDHCRALPKGRDPHHSALQLHVSRDTA